MAASLTFFCENKALTGRVPVEMVVKNDNQKIHVTVRCRYATGDVNQFCDVTYPSDIKKGRGIRCQYSLTLPLSHYNL